MSPLSKLAESLVGSEIVKLGNEINQRIANGANILNYTIGDFDPKIFPISPVLKQEIINAYQDGFTNYPPADGILSLRRAVTNFVEKYQKVKYELNEVQISCGGRPFIYTLFRTIVDPGDKVIYAIPSWNNNHYTSICGGIGCEIEAKPENDFMPTARDIEAHINDAVLVCLCSPQNPTGTVLKKETLEEICDLILAENQRRSADQKKVYLLFDQMYCMLTYNGIETHHPVELRPAMKEFTVCLDGMSKSFAGTGIRVGWGLGPANIIGKMKAMMSHIGAWAPLAEQHGCAAFLNSTEAVETALSIQKKAIEERLLKFYTYFEKLKAKGFSIDAIEPKAAIYLTVKIDLVGKTCKGKLLQTQDDVTTFLLDEVGVALVPFYCFGADHSSPWYRISVGTAKMDDIDKLFENFERALMLLK